MDEEVNEAKLSVLPFAGGGDAGYWSLVLSANSPSTYIATVLAVMVRGRLWTIAIWYHLFSLNTVCLKRTLALVEVLDV